MYEVKILFKDNHEMSFKGVDTVSFYTASLTTMSISEFAKRPGLPSSELSFYDKECKHVHMVTGREIKAISFSQQN